MTERLHIWHRERLVGVLERDRMVYDSTWLADGFAISESLPLRAEPHAEAGIRWFANLLPEGGTRDRLARRLRLSPDDDLALLGALGRECAGALVLTENDECPQKRAQIYRPLEPEELAELGSISGNLPLLQEEGRLSLAGAQDKLPVRLGSGGELLLSTEGAPSSHLLKLPNRDFGGLVENELLCLRLAEAVGLPVVEAQLVPLGDTQGLLLKRYDRVEGDGKTPSGLVALERLHQEDFAQALAQSRHNKYEEDGGSSLQDCTELIRRTGTQPVIEIRELLRWLFFNLVIGNRDNHSKNLSRVLQGSSARWRISPFYDLVNTTAYPGLSKKLSFFIGQQKTVEGLRPHHWEQLAEDLGVSSKLLVREGERMVERVELSLSPTLEKTGEELGSDARLTAVARAITKTLRSGRGSLK